jgi:hypothetical protein
MARRLSKNLLSDTVIAVAGILITGKSFAQQQQQQQQLQACSVQQAYEQL